MERFVLTDVQWAKMEPHCLGKPTDPGRSGSDNRRFVEAVLWIARTGSPWRDLPLFFGNWNSVFKRYRDWVKAGVFIRLFEACSDEPDMEYAMVDATIVKVHRHGQGAKGGRRTRRSAAARQSPAAVCSARTRASSRNRTAPKLSHDRSRRLPAHGNQYNSGINRGLFRSE